MQHATSLEQDFARLGLSEYTERFIQEGFDNWSTIADITESDASSLGMKLGHRRILFREIATMRGHPQSEPLPSEEHLVERSPVNGTCNSDDGNQRTSAGEANLEDDSQSSSNPARALEKRRYKRHPKPDDNAPVRPPSAYVLFANQVRGEQTDSKLTFTQLARLVGEKWKNLAPEEKTIIEAQAAESKRQYTTRVTEYKTSNEYRMYQDYLSEFKHRARRDQKPEKLEPPRKAQKYDSSESFEHATFAPPPRLLDNPQTTSMARPSFTIPSIMHIHSDSGQGGHPRLPQLHPERESFGAGRSLFERPPDPYINRPFPSHIPPPPPSALLTLKREESSSSSQESREQSQHSPQFRRLPFVLPHPSPS